MTASNSDEQAGIPKRSADRKKDIETLHRLLPKLDDDSLLAVYLRFWERMTIQEIAKIIGRTWDETDHLIENSIQNLRDGFLARELMPMAVAA